jgi:DNA-binding NarL/FixJ family response regulator
LTSTFSDKKRQEAMRAGATAYFRKNVSIETLATAIRETAKPDDL